MARESKQPLKDIPPLPDMPEIDISKWTRLLELDSSIIEIEAEDKEAYYIRYEDTIRSFYLYKAGTDEMSVFPIGQVHLLRVSADDQNDE